MKQHIAIIGSGVSGLVSAYYLSQKYQVDLFESSERIGGHTHTVSVAETQQKIPIDTGFIVFNQENYPEFLKFLTALNVPYQNSDMSFSVTCTQRHFCWGSDFPQGVFAQKKHWISPSFYRFLLGVNRFNNHCLAALKEGLNDQTTLQEFLTHHQVSPAVIDDYVLPMASAIWSGSFQDMLGFPIRSFIQFWNNHQLLEIGKGLQWKTITNGAQSYIDKVMPTISGQIHTRTPVQEVQRTDDGVRIRVAGEWRLFDAVVIATHADTAYRLLQTPSSQESDLLGQWQYSENNTYLHSDTRVMPFKRKAWCSWNLRKPKPQDTGAPATVTYWMNRLQSLPTNTPYFVTLNPEEPIDPTLIHKEIKVTHPIMSQAAMATQPKLPELNKQSRIVYCGSYFGYGFHEDAAASAVRAAKALSETLEQIQ